MYNCLIDDTDIRLKVTPKGFIYKDEDYNKYYFKLIILQKDVIPLLKNGITPIYDSDNFIIPVELTTYTLLTINNIEIINITDPKLLKLNDYKLYLKYIYLKKRPHIKRPISIFEYYASKARFNIPRNERKNRTPWT